MNTIFNNNDAYETDYFTMIIHNDLSNSNITNKNIQKFPYSIVFSSEFSRPPVNRKDLEGLAHFILNYLTEHK